MKILIVRQRPPKSAVTRTCTPLRLLFASLSVCLHQATREQGLPAPLDPQQYQILIVRQRPPKVAVLQDLLSILQDFKIWTPPSETAFRQSVCVSPSSERGSERGLPASLDPRQYRQASRASGSVFDSANMPGRLFYKARVNTPTTAQPRFNTSEPLFDNLSGNN